MIPPIYSNDKIINDEKVKKILLYYCLMRL